MNRPRIKEHEYTNKTHDIESELSIQDTLINLTTDIESERSIQVFITDFTDLTPSRLPQI